MSHISFSELKIWNECAWKHKLVYLDKIAGFKGNEHTAFGSAVHSACEQLVEHNINIKNAEEHFQEQFLKELRELPEELNLNKKLIGDMRTEGKMLMVHVLPALKEYFGEYELISVEEKLFEPIKSHEGYSFKGFVDLVLKTSDGKYHVIENTILIQKILKHTLPFLREQLRKIMLNYLELQAEIKKQKTLLNY